MDPQIHEWQKAVLPNPDEEAIGIAKVFSECSDLWRAIARILTQQKWIQKGTIRKLESAHSYIHLWADGYDVLSGQFEERLKNSQRAGDLTIRLLQNICRILTQELTPVVTGLLTVASEDITSLSLAAADLALTSERLAILVQGDNESDSSEDGEVVASSESVPHEKLLDDIADDLRSDTQCLLDLGARFEEQVMNPIASEAAANPSNSFDGGLCDTFIERVIRSYPQCESNLAGRLGKSNWLRFLKIAGLKPRTSDNGVVQDRDTEEVNDAAESESVDFRSIVDTISIREQSLFHDSGLGTASHVSVNHLDTNESGPVTQTHPPLPEGAIQGKPFHCIACKGRVMITTEEEWRKHLLRDIEPYVCPAPECSAPPFSSLKLLEIHMSIRHPFSTIWDDSRCRICGKDVNNKLRIILHLADHMEAIALSIVPQGPGIGVDNVLITDTHDKNEELSPGFNPEHKKTLRAPRPKVKTGCNQCKMRRIKCDEQRPFCGNCVTKKLVCAGYPPPSRVLQAKDDTKFTELPSSPGHPQNAKPQDRKTRDFSDEWLPLFPDARPPSSTLDKDSFKDMTPHGELQSPSVDNASNRPPLPPSSHVDYFTPLCGIGAYWDNGTDPWLNTRVPYSVHPTVEPAPFIYDNIPGYPQPDITRKPSDSTSDQSYKSSQRRDKPLPPIIVEDPEDTSAMKRARNTLAARKSRFRKAQRLEELEEKIAKLEQERDKWKNVAMKHGAELP